MMAERMWPIEPQYAESMKVLVRAIDECFNGEARGADRKTGFVLLVFPFGDSFDGRCNYISNGAHRGDIVRLFKEQIKRFEEDPSRDLQDG